MLQNRSLLPKVEVLSPQGDKTSICCIKLLQSVLNFYYHKITKKCKGGGYPPPPHVAEKVRTQCNILSLHMRPTVLAKNWRLVGCPKVPCTRWLLSVVLWYGGDSRLHDDEMVEWLKCWTANPMCCARMGSSPILVDIFAHTWIREAEKLYQRPTKGESYKCHIQNTQNGFRHRELNPGHLGESQVS